MAGEDHLSLANQQVGDVEGLLVLVWTREVLFIQFLEAHHEVTETSEEELAAVHPVGVTLTLPFDGMTHRPASNYICLRATHSVERHSAGLVFLTKIYINCSGYLSFYVNENLRKKTFFSFIESGYQEVTGTFCYFSVTKNPNKNKYYLA